MDAPRVRQGGEAGDIHGARSGRGTHALAARLFRPMLDGLDRGIAAGSLDVTLPDGSRRILGGRAPGPTASVDIRRWRALLRLITGGSSGWYEAWAHGDWASPDPVALFELFGRNRRDLAAQARSRGLPLLIRRAAHWLRRNHRDGSRRNIAFHYDLGNDFYAAWLDPSMSYSSGIFAEAAESLEAAQAAKLAAILDRTGTEPGESILEIGCGWGSFVEVAARAGRRVHAITISEAQKRFVDDRIAAKGLAGAEVAITDYRDVTGSFDAVASIEMVEAVGREYWPHYLATIARVLKPGGHAAIQYIAFDDALYEGYAGNVDFIQTHIFPGGMLLSESRFRAIAEANGLAWRDPISFGASYAETLRQWRMRFEAAVREGRLPGEFDAKFIDLWRYYLMYCEGGFRGGGIDVAQVTLVKEG